jgi:hypothetical protein
MFDWYDGMHSHSPVYGQAGSSLGPEYLINDAGDVSPVHSATNSSHSSSNFSATSSRAPSPTLVGTTNGLQIDLIWDASVANAPGGFMQAIIHAAQYYARLYSSPTGGPEVINIDVGYGEIAGTSLASNALGESDSYGYLTNFTTVKNALTQDGYSFTASNEPTTSQFFVTSAEAKTLGLISSTSSAVDGYIGFSTLSGTGYSWNQNVSVSASNTGTGSSQFDLQAVAMHEISEVMGRISMEGAIVNGQHTYTPLDLFNYKSPGVLELSRNGGYFSVNNGTTNLGTYNNASGYGGDIADWASATSITQSKTLGLTAGDYDAYDAFTAPGYNGGLSQSDIIENAALGYKLTPFGVAAA